MASRQHADTPLVREHRCTVALLCWSPRCFPLDAIRMFSAFYDRTCTTNKTYRRLTQRRWECASLWAEDTYAQVASLADANQARWRAGGGRGLICF